MAEIRQKLGFDAQQAIQTLSQLTTALNNANDALAKMKTSATGAQALTKVTEGTKKASKAANEFLVSWKTIIRVLETQLIVRGLNTMITGLKEAVESARELGLAIEEVRTIDAAGRTAADISKQVLALSDAIGQAPTDLAEGLYQTLSNQVVEAADSFQFMSESARLAKVTASETGDAVNALSSVMNSYNKSIQEAEHVSGTLFATVEQGRLRLGEIANVIGRVTPLTSQLAISWEETAAAIATMTRQGVRADTAITQLRAVVTRLLKPTDDLREIFRKWGVEDGRQAIETFGGLTGVLRKLSEETGGNSQEMAVLLRNVRAIAGVFGIMNDEGRTMEEILGIITESTTAATDAWAEFTKSDAQKLTVEMQRFENLLTRIGSKSLPTVTKVLAGLVTGLEGFGVGLQVITGTWTEAEQGAVDFEHAVQRGIQQGRQLQKAWAEAGKDAYSVITKASLKYYAEANKKEQQLATVRDNAIESATAAFENVVDRLTDMYANNLKKIEKFAQEAASNVESAFQKIADIQRDIADRTLEHQLDKAKSNYKKLEVLNEAYLDSLQKQRKAAAGITADPKSIKDFEDAQDGLIDKLDRRLQLLKEMDAPQSVIDKTQKRITDELRNGQRAQVAFAKQSVGVMRTSDEVAANFSDVNARVQEIGKRMKEIHADGVVDPGEEAELASLTAELGKLNDKAQEAADTMRSFGLDIQFSDVVDGLTNALNQAHKDWSAEVARARSAFEGEVFKISVALDPEGARREFQQVAGMEAVPGEGAAAFQRRIDTEAAATLQKRLDLTSQIQVLEKQNQAPLKATVDLLGSAARINSEDVATYAQRRQEANGLFSILTGQKGTMDIILANEQNRLAAAFSLQNAYSGMLQDLQASRPVEESALQNLKERTQEAFNNKNISQEQFDIYQQMGKQLDLLVQTSQRQAELESQMPTEERAAAAEKVKAQADGIAASTQNELSIRSTLNERMNTASQTMEGMRTSTEGTANAAEKTANATGEAATQGGNFTSNVAGAVEPLGTAAGQATVLADEMERAAAAAAAVSNVSVPTGGGAAQFHGGSFYADGGMFRGQDRQLAALAQGEMVINQKSSRRFFSELNAINQGSQPVYREQGGPVTNVGDVNVTVQGGDSSQQTVREIGHALRREIRRGNIKLR